MIFRTSTTTIKKIGNLFKNCSKKHQSSLSGTSALQETDPEIYQLLVSEKNRQKSHINLIASENYSSCAVAEVNSSCLNNKMTEGYPGARYYGGSQVVDKVESLSHARALELFGLSEDEWAVNVQPLSGSPANLQAFTALAKPGDRIMGLDFKQGGHFTHGYKTPTEKISAASRFFECMDYKLNKETMLIDYDELESTARLFRPKIIVAGTCFYSRLLDYERYRRICDDVGAYMLADMAHISGLIAGKVIPSPFEYADVVTSTTHKSFRGPRSGIIFSRKNVGGVNLPAAIDSSVFPCFQGAVHMHIIGALAVAMKEAMSPEFMDYQEQVVSNAHTLASHLMNLNYSILTGGTDNHLMIVNLRPFGIDGFRAQIACEEAGIILNRIPVPYDDDSIHPGGVRIGTPAVTSRGIKTAGMKQIGQFLHEAFSIGLKISSCTENVNDYIKMIEKDEQMHGLADRVNKFITQFETRGHPEI